MEILTTNSVVKKVILILLVIIMLNNFIVPNYVRAGDDIVTKLVKGFFGLLVTLADAALGTMQKIMIGPRSLENLGKYEILYSPGIIFSNNVAALKVDFIGQTEEYTTIKYAKSNIKTEDQLYELALSVISNKENYVEGFIVNNQSMFWLQSKILGTILYYEDDITLSQLHSNDWNGVDAYYPDWEDFKDNLDGDWTTLAGSDSEGARLFNAGKSAGDGEITLSDIEICTTGTLWGAWDDAIVRI